MIILTRPEIVFNDYGKDVVIFISNLDNQEAANKVIIKYIQDAFNAEGRIVVERVGKTNYFSISLELEENESLSDITNKIMNAYEKGLYNGIVIRIPDEEMKIQAEFYISFSLKDLSYKFKTEDLTNEQVRTKLKENVLEGDQLNKVTIDNFFANHTNYECVQFKQAQLDMASFEHAILPLTDFTEASLKYANFEKADLRYANLTGANLTEANLKGANLTGADLTGADLTGANFTGAIGVSPPLPLLLKKRIKPEEEDRTKVLKETIWEPQNVYNTGTSQSPIWNVDEIDENDITRFKTTKRGPRKRMVVTRAEYSIKPAEYESVDPAIVTLYNEESDVGKILNEELLFEDETISLKDFFSGPDGFLFRVVNGDKFEDILIANKLYEPTTVNYLQNSHDLILYTCDEPGSMNKAKINLSRPLLDMGKALGMPSSRIYVDYSSFIKSLLEDVRKYKCYILYKDTRLSEKYKSLASYNAVYNPMSDTQVYVSNLHCNAGEDMNGVIWTVKPIGDNLLKKSKTTSGKINKTKGRIAINPRPVRKVLHRRTTARALTAADEITGGGTRKKIKRRTIKRRNIKRRTKRN